MSILSISGQEQVQGPKVQQTIIKYKERAESIKKYSPRKTPGEMEGLKE